MTPQISIAGADNYGDYTPFTFTVSLSSISAQEWTRFRGPNGSGESEATTIPAQWTDKDINWKTSLPGIGHSSPVLWGDKIFLLTAVKTEKVVDTVPAEADQPKRPFGIVFPRNYYQFTILCLDRATGKTLWKQVATERVPHEGVHPDNDFASASQSLDRGTGS